MNTKAKGNRNERTAKKYFEDLGYTVIKAGASLGMFDLVAMSDSYHGSITNTTGNHIEKLGSILNLNKLLLIQVKSNRMPTIHETADIIIFDNFPHGQTMKLIFIVYGGTKGRGGKKQTFEILNLTEKQ